MCYVVSLGTTIEEKAIRSVYLLSCSVLAYLLTFSTIPLIRTSNHVSISLTMWKSTSLIVCPVPNAVVIPVVEALVGTGTIKLQHRQSCKEIHLPTAELRQRREQISPRDTMSCVEKSLSHTASPSHLRPRPILTHLPNRAVTSVPSALPQPTTTRTRSSPHSRHTMPRAIAQLRHCAIVLTHYHFSCYERFSSQTAAKP